MDLEIISLLDQKVEEFNRPEFIDSDPIQIPHQFTRKEDIEISAFLAATIAWGQRPQIIKSAQRIMNLMENEPFDFVTQHQAKDLKRFNGFVYRTFQEIDLVFFIRSLQHIYKEYGGLENLFQKGYEKEGTSWGAINEFRRVFFLPDHPERTHKHVSNPLKGAASKRLHMFLRWMVRVDNRGVDFGIWKNISAADLKLPLDVHTGNVGRKLGLLTRKANDRRSVDEITDALSRMNPEDPIRYDYALFGLGVFEGF